MATSLRRRPSPWRDRRGIAALEMAVVAPFVMFVILACIDFGRALSQNIELTHAVRAGAQYSVTASDDKTGIERAVRAALPAKFSAAEIAMTCHCGPLPAGSTAMPPAMDRCDDACPVGSARMTRIQTSFPFRPYNFMFGQSVATALRITRVAANVTIRHQ